jgi:hypothetical protein
VQGKLTVTEDEIRRVKRAFWVFASKLKAEGTDLERRYSMTPSPESDTKCLSPDEGGK